MKLLTDEIERKLDEAGYHGEEAVAKFFNPVGAGTWIVFGRDPEDPDILWGVADLGFVEAGPFRLSELEDLDLAFGLGIERDLHFAHEGEPLDFFLSRDTLAGV